MINLIEMLHGVQKTARGWVALCPAHDDGNASLSIARTDDRWLIHCHAGCSFQEVIDALGVEAADLFTRDGRGHR